MENRIVALSVLENLIHWPLPSRSGYSALTRGSGENDEDGSAAAALVSAGDAEDLSREPRQRKQDRYRAVLLLPYLCHKLGTRWAETEIVPYLLRCVEEDDPQLALVAGMALLGVTLPCRSTLGPATSASSGGSLAASSTFHNASSHHFGAFLSVEDVQPVCALLAASSAEETRQFAAQVVLPHLFFGVALERDVTLESWDLKYVPLSVLQADMATTAASMEANDAAEYLESEDSNPIWAAGTVGNSSTDDGAASTARLMAAVRKQLQRKHQLTMKARASAARASFTSSEGARHGLKTTSFTTGRGKDSDVSPSLADATDRPAPTEQDVRMRCYDLALEDESVQFLWSGSYVALTGPWCFDGSGRLSSLCSDVRNACGRCRSVNGASASRVLASFHCFRRHRRRVDSGQMLRGEPPASCLPLSGADLDLYGAAYASDAGTGNCDDFFSVNVRARALVGGLVRWMDALAPPAAAATARSPNPGAGTPRSTRPDVDRSLSLVDYLCCDERRDVLRGRWRSLIKALQEFLESPYPGPVAAAVETVSELLHAIQTTLWETEQQQQQQQQQQRVKSGSAGARADPLRSKATSTDAGAEVDAWSGIRVPDDPLLTTAELQMFIYRMARRHVAYCIAAAVSTRTVSAPSSPTATSKVRTDSVGRLMRSALITAQGLLTDLLLRHHVLMKLDLCRVTASTTTPESRHRRSSLDGSYMMLQVGVGPKESRLASYSVWDVSFACINTNAGAVTAATPNMADEATFLMPTTPAIDGRTEKGSTKWLPGTLHAASVFRLHRLVRRALLRALPLCVDFPCIFFSCASARALSNASTSGTSASVASVFSLSSVCPMLLQVLVPPNALPPLLNVLQVTIELQHEAEKDKAASGKHAGEAAAPTPSTLHIDPAGPSMTAPTLWAAMTAAGSVLDLGTAAAEAPSTAQESPASVDFTLLEAALDAVQRLIAEAVVQLPAAPQTGPLRSASTPINVAVPPPSHTLDAVCAQLFILLAACLRWVPRYTNWRARWLIAQRLPRLTATLHLFLVRISSFAEEADASTAPGLTAHQTRAQTWMAHTLHLLTSLWTCSPQFGTAPLNDLTDDEEVEVRCIAAQCAARCFGGATEAVLRLSSSAVAGDESACTNARTMSQQSFLLPLLRERLWKLLDAISQGVLAAASDSDKRVLCRSVEALAGLSRTLSLLVVADPSPSPPSTSSTSAGNEEPSVWTRYLHSHTDALLRLMTDHRPTVQLALVSQLTDLLLMRMRPSPHTKQAKGPPVGDEGVASWTCDPDGDGEEGRKDDTDAQHRSPDEVQYDALLQCLRQLSQHELWRLREQYAVLLAHLCGRLLLTTAAVPTPSSNGRDANAHLISLMDFSAASAERVSRKGGPDATTRGFGPDAALWAHTHPLYQLARTELLTLLVAVLFDKVKAVRDAALDAVEQMCVQLAVANCRSAVGTSAGGDGRARQGTAGRQLDSGFVNEGIHSSADAAASGSLNTNTFVDDVLWPRIYAYAPAWETYLSRSALLRIAMRLRVNKISVFIPLLDQLARDPVLNVRLVVAKVILEVLLVSSPEVHATKTPPPLLLLEPKDDEMTGSTTSAPTPISSYRPELPSGTVAYSLLMNKPVPPLLIGNGSGKGGAAAIADVVLPPLQFDEVERAGVILQILRQLLKDPSSDVRDEAAKALKVCY
ncbi:hypothetical protein, conserved [Leishmania tarentolae]|uniref:Uncharacterized protein n=1 Tax=Leishmania tarentolae TaxID=5689 RepID=A0A640KBN2_LEITA|nr:hypothetical protein, conserved [Leishmania tarentolae]